MDEFLKQCIAVNMKKVVKKFLQGSAVDKVTLVKNREVSGPQCINSVYYVGTASHLNVNKKAQLSLTNPRDACEKFARFT